MIPRGPDPTLIHVHHPTPSFGARGGIYSRVLPRHGNQRNFSGLPGVRLPTASHTSIPFSGSFQNALMRKHLPRHTLAKPPSLIGSNAWRNLYSSLLPLIAAKAGRSSVVLFETQQLQSRMSVEGLVFSP